VPQIDVNNTEGGSGKPLDDPGWAKARDQRGASGGGMGAGKKAQNTAQTGRSVGNDSETSTVIEARGAVGQSSRVA
jgi:hypothetical protein